jgi:hypothetical protein
MVGINVILSCGKEYVNLAWEFICKPGQENLDFLQVKKSEMTRKTKKYLSVLKSSVSWKNIAEKLGWEYQVFRHSKIFDMT